MKKILYVFVVALMTMFVSCDKNENVVDDQSTPTNPEELYAKTEYNLDMRDFAMAVNEAIYFVEDDGGAKWRDITIDAKGFEKIKLDSTSVSNVEGVLKSINALGKTFSTWLESADEKIGYTYLNYYDDPSMECSTGSAPSGGYLTVKYKDHE